MKKTMIFSVVLLIITTASLGILRAMHNGNSQNDVATLPDGVKHHQANATGSSQGGQPPTVIHQDSSNVHVIDGRVVDPQGNPVEGMEVIIARSTGGILLGSKTNADGYFAIKELAAGIYEVFTKDENGPLCPSCPFYSGKLPSPSFTTLTLVEGEVTPSIVLQTPPKLGKLTGRVFDAETNEPILASRITLRRTDNPEYFSQRGPDEEGSFEIPLPPVAVTMEVESGGYKSWTYVNPSLPVGHRDGASLKLRIGESRKLEVGLQKLALQRTLN